MSEPRLTMFDFRFTMYHSPAVYGRGDVIGSTLQPRRKETGRQGDKETRRQGDKETRRQGEGETRRVGGRHPELVEGWGRR